MKTKIQMAERIMDAAAHIKGWLQSSVILYKV